jgi:hypothetical protein
MTLIIPEPGIYTIKIIYNLLINFLTKFSPVRSIWLCHRSRKQYSNIWNKQMNYFFREWLNHQTKGIRMFASSICSRFSFSNPDWWVMSISPVEYRTILRYRPMIPLFPIDEVCPVCCKACLDTFGEHVVWSL